MANPRAIKPPRPLALRALSAEKRAKHLLGRGPRLTVDRVRTIASMAAGGRTDTGDPYWEPALDVLLESALEADLTWAGRYIIETMAWSSLARRIQLLDHLDRHPGLRDEPLRPPFLIMGMARTGTTHLHRLLSLDPAFHGPPMWELLRPAAPHDGPDDRRDMAWADNDRTRKKRGGRADHIHYADPDTPEECTILLMSTFASGQFWGAGPVTRYAQWAMTEGMDLLDHIYGDYRDFLLTIQSHNPGRALSLKSPTHFPALSAIRKVVPEAMLIHTVRHPTSWVTSSNSLVYAGHAETARRIDPQALGDTNQRMMEAGWDAHRRAREACPGEVIDVYYDDIVSRPIEVVRSIYDFHGVEWPDGHDARLQAYLDRNQQAKHGGHRYQASDFGTTDADISARFADYIDYFGLE